MKSTPRSLLAIATIFLLLIGISPPPVVAQEAIMQVIPQNVPWRNLTVASGGQCVPNLLGSGFTSHTITFSVNGSASAVLVTVTGSTGGAFSTITTSTSTTGATLNFSGIYTGICFAVTTLTSSAGAVIDANYAGELGSPAAGGTQDVNLKQVAGAAVNTGNGTAAGSQRVTIASDSTPFTAVLSPNPSFVTAWAGTSGTFTVSSAGTSQVIGVTAVTTSAGCTNFTASAVNLTIMDGAGKYMLGPNFSLPAKSALPANWAYGAVWTSGINVSAGTASAVNCNFQGFN